MDRDLDVLIEYMVIDWDNMSKKLDMDIEFIRRYKHKLNWRIIISHHSLSNEFLLEFEDYINFYDLCKYQNVTEEFKKVFKNQKDTNDGELGRFLFELGI